MAREMSQVPILPQMPHSTVNLGRQLWQRGPSSRRTATGLRWRLEVGGIPDQAVGTQRIALIVAGRGFTHGSTTGASNRRVASEAHPANSLAFQ